MNEIIFRVQPHAINPGICSLRGWRNSGPDTLRCSACGAVVVVSMPTTWGGAEAASAANKYAARLIEAHAPGCAWRSVATGARGSEWWDQAAELALFPAPARAQRIHAAPGFNAGTSIVLLQTLMADFRARYDALSRVEQLPHVSDSCIESMDRMCVTDGDDGGDVDTSAATASISAPVQTLVRREDSRVKRAMSSTVGLSVPVAAELDYSRSRVLLAASGWMPRLMPFSVSQNEEGIGVTAMGSLSQVAERRRAVNLVVSPTGPANDTDTVPPSARPRTLAGASHGPSTKWNASSVVLECASCGAQVPLWMTRLGKDSKLQGLDTILAAAPAALAFGGGASAGDTAPAKRLRVDIPKPRARPEKTIDLFGSIAGGPSPIARMSSGSSGGAGPTTIARGGGTGASGSGAIQVPFGRGAASCTPVMEKKKRVLDVDNGEDDHAGDDAVTRSGGASNGRRRSDSKTRGAADVLALHRPYCPWYGIDLHPLASILSYAHTRILPPRCMFHPSARF